MLKLTVADLGKPLENPDPNRSQLNPAVFLNQAEGHLHPGDGNLMAALTLSK